MSDGIRAHRTLKTHWRTKFGFRIGSELLAQVARMGV